jgi:hypothetical protein
MTKYLIALTSVGLLLGQRESRPPLSEAEFRAVVQNLVAGHGVIDIRISEFALRHDNVAVPILVEGIRARWAMRPAEDAAVPILRDEIRWNPVNRPNATDRQAVGIVTELLDLATLLAEKPAVGAVGRLCSEYRTDCRFFVMQLLMNAGARGHLYTTADELVREYPGVADVTIAYVEAGLKNGGAENLYARELLQRVAKGDKIESELVLPRLAPATRQKVMGAVDYLKRDMGQAAPK